MHAAVQHLRGAEVLSGGLRDDRYLRDEDEAQDIVQETFVTLIDSYDTLKDKNKVAAWLKKIAANKCLDRLRRTKTVNAEDDFFENVEAQPEDFLPDSILESDEKRKIIMNIIDNSLSEDIRRTLILFYYDEMTTKEIASLLDIPQGTVLWRLNYAKKKIKKEVEKYEEENNDKLYAMASAPFLTKLFAKEAEQVPLKPMSSSLIELSASSNAPAKAETAKIASAATAKGGLGIAAYKIILIVLAVVLAVAAAIGLIIHNRVEPEETTEETVTSQTEDTDNAVAETTDDASVADTSVDLSVDIIGTWVGNDNSNNAVYMTFYENGNMDYWMADASGNEIYRDNCTYNLDGNEMEMIRSDGTSSGLLPVTVDGDTLTIEDMVFTRTDLTEIVTPSAAPATSADYSADVIGAWTMSDGNYYYYFTFNEDGTLEYLELTEAGVENDRQTFTFTVDGDQMTWTTSDGTSMTTSYTVEGDTLTIVNSAYPDEPLVLTRSDESSPVYTVSDLVGTWVSSNTLTNYIWLEFHEDGSLDLWVVDASGVETNRANGTFTIEGNVLRYYLPDGTETNAYTIIIDGDYMGMAENGSTVIHTEYTRVG